MKTYNYNKLKGRIREIFGTQEKYAESLGISVTSINYKLNCKVPFTQDEISKSIEILNILPNEIQDIFFNSKVENNSTNVLDKNQLKDST